MGPLDSRGGGRLAARAASAASPLRTAQPAGSIWFLDCRGSAEQGAALCRSARGKTAGQGAVLVPVRAPGATWALRPLVEVGADDCFLDVPEGGPGELAMARTRRLGDERASAGLCAARLERSEERFRLHANATNDAIYDWDWVEDAIAWNDHHEAIEHVERAWHWWRSRVHPQDRARVVSAFRDMLKRAGALWRQEFRFRHRERSACARGEATRRSRPTAPASRRSSASRATATCSATPSTRSRSRPGEPRA